MIWISLFLLPMLFLAWACWRSPMRNDISDRDDIAPLSLIRALGLTLGQWDALSDDEKELMAQRLRERYSELVDND